jgi:hypothetical protein
MKNHEFIEKNIGAKVYITPDGDLSMSSHLRYLISTKAELEIVKLTKGGMAYLKDKNGNFFSVPPKNVREIQNNLPNVNL